MTLHRDVGRTATILEVVYGVRGPQIEDPDTEAVLLEIQSMAMNRDRTPLSPTSGTTAPLFHRVRVGIIAIVAAAAALTAGSALAAPEEIQVYLDDATAPGKFGLDIHNNYALSGTRDPDEAGGRAANHVYRLTPEFYYGLAPGLELGAYLLTARDAAGDIHVDGAKMRLKYIAPHDDKQGAFWGANLEVGRSTLAVAPQPWNYELKGIWGLRRGPWLLAANIDIDASLSAQGGPAELALDLRLARDVGHGTQLALETYSELGELSHPGAVGNHSQHVYAVLDRDFGSFDLEAGIGRGLTSASDPWVLKAIVGLHF